MRDLNPEELDHVYGAGGKGRRGKKRRNKGSNSGRRGRNSNSGRRSQGSNSGRRGGSS